MTVMPLRQTLYSFTIKYRAKRFTIVSVKLLHDIPIKGNWATDV